MRNKVKENNEANDFAMQLLMPGDKFHEYVTEESPCIDDISNHFQVTPKVVQIRAKQLGYDIDCKK